MKIYYWESFALVKGIVRMDRVEEAVTWANDSR